MSDHPERDEIRLTDGAFYAGDPHRSFQWMREHAPVYWDASGQVWGVARYADVLAISKDPQTFSNAAGMRPDQPPLPNMINLDDPAHKNRRGLVSRGFTPRCVAEHEPRIRDISVELIERAKARGRFDFVRDIAAWLPLIVIGDMLGVDPADYAHLLEWSEAMIIGSGATAPEHFERASRAFEDYLTYQRRVIEDRRARPRDDLVSQLVADICDGASVLVHSFGPPQAWPTDCLLALAERGDEGFLLREIAPGLRIDDVKAATAAPLRVASDVGEMQFV